VAIHSAVHVSMGEADEIATQKVAAFALEFPTNREEPFFTFRPSNEP